MAWVACFGFFNEKYLIALVDFIAPCGGTIERGERDLRIPFSPPSGLPPSFPGKSLRRDIGLPRAYRDIGILYPLQTVYRHFDVMFGCFVFGSVSHAFQSVLFGLYRLFFIIGWKKDAVCVAFLLVFLITADREMVPISFCASPFHQIGWAESYCKNAFVRRRLLMIWYSIPFSTNAITSTAVSANPTKNHGKNLK